MASLGELGGVVPYTAYNARISFIKENPEVIKSFTKAVQKGLDYIHNTSSEKIAENILSFFPDTPLNDLISAIDRYKENDSWPKETKFTKDSFDHLQEIIVEAKVLKEDEKVLYEDLIYEP